MSTRRHTDSEEEPATPTSAPPPNKRCNMEENGSEAFIFDEPKLSEKCGPTMRRFREKQVRNISFAIPEGYNYDKLEYLGGGTYGNVIKTTFKRENGKEQTVAIKKLREPFHDPQQARKIYREIELLQLMRHDNIICALDVYSPNNFENFKDIYIVTEYAGQSLFRVLKHQRDRSVQILKADHVKFITYQLIRALKYIHSANVIHRDLKPGNLALTDDCDLTVLDFGLARTLENADTTLTTYVQTRWYRSPEVIYWKFGSYSNSADMWSVGCIAAELLTGEPLFPGDDANLQYQRITQLCGSPSEDLLNKIERDNSAAMRQVIQSYKQHKRQDFKEYFKEHRPSEDLIDFLEKILVLDPERRLSVEEAIAHPYLAEFSLPDDEPSAGRHFDLNDGIMRTGSEWKKIIWEQIKNFQRLETSPKVPQD
ncbi:unnamed protein product [Caenorhabditis angaria]|uniref:mitogen-activated protein kinase n=1 Tax=Caenorhabditis angaria TaxID=860376 RepID=A0A9P1N391_9PELO|nr:unnamed protein product [Caenorhabditis angaria]